MKVNTYGLAMHGLRKAAGETKGLTDCYSGHYLQINYDTVSGDVLTNEHYSLGQNSWTQYRDTNIIKVGNATGPMTMQGIADWIADTIARRNLQCAELGG